MFFCFCNRLKHVPDDSFLDDSGHSSQSFGDRWYGASLRYTRHNGRLDNAKNNQFPFLNINFNKLLLPPLSTFML